MSEEITDALAASLLKKEATERSLRYSAFGLVAFAGDRKKPNSAPKPNTRFLKNLVKEADSHNAALLAKEAEDARSRLEKLRREGGRGKGRGRDREKEVGRHHRRSGRSRSPDGKATRRKERSRSRSVERRTKDRVDDRKGVKRQRVEIGDIDRLLQASRRERRDGEKGKDKEKDRERSNRDRERSYSRERGSHRDRRDKERRRSKSRDRTKRSHRSSRRSRTRSPSHSRSRSSSPPDKRKHKSHKRQKSRSPSPPNSRSPCKRKRSNSPKISRLSPPQDDDEDPLAEYLAKKSANRSPEIGPSFPYKSKNGPRPRGRGLPGSSAMDARFDPSYDPTMDVTPTNPEDVDDWEAAIEALRDRQKWKQQGKERLKAAGFDNDFIEAWETNTTKDESRIKWSKDKGGRDWDRGKVIDDETGEIKLKASWGTS
ncbi:hypothetical protein TWF506_001284 [Arthrobotrys conoides]|uniref:Pre-mRNA-splicing factor 38B n=1 Tax=Arthrobotrys conoides TaxID=74498 RepID=A0AAN8P1S9_9PEZI